MRKIGNLGRASLLAAALMLSVVAAAQAANPKPTSAARIVVKTAQNKALGKKILVTAAGRALYFLSAETSGKFICTNNACRSFWTPLAVKGRAKPTGVRSLGTIRRPDGALQVTYRGHPLYTFNGDTKPGDVKGNGFKDVGTWLVAQAGATSSSPAPANPGGYGGYRP